MVSEGDAIIIGTYDQSEPSPRQSCLLNIHLCLSAVVMCRTALSPYPAPLFINIADFHPSYPHICPEGWLILKIQPQSGILYDYFIPAGYRIG